MLPDEQVFAQRGDFFVVIELRPPVVALGGVGQNFHQHRWVGDRVIGVFRELHRPADDGKVGIGEQTGFLNLDPQVGVKGHAGTSLESQAELGADIRPDETVHGRAPSHREHLPAEELALERRSPFEGEEFTFRQHLNWCRSSHK